ncbi:DUF1269 domain-containing protein [Ferrimicrobium sp.]|uniref:DUF1269 domain-containing protein n=1 Tax=Ferrimicrobium sp. TaxID=2926050 RepID=UPI002604AA71|nr:DUF1269 domain-containing protein [Ferrimicrobium sp.]
MADLIMLKFDHSYDAQRALGAVRALEELRYAWVDNVAVVEKHKSGITTLSTPHGSAAGGAFLGGLAGILLFWWFPPAWFFGGWLGGMGAGAAIGELWKRSGIDEKLVAEVKSELAPGTSALLLVGASGDADQMARAFEPYHPSKVVRNTISDETVENLRQAFEQANKDS